ncbi:CDP-diacylglycerol--glycerol-3-phosphate 3-phosphatidyltransferase [Carnobacterium iners]|uniref:CDP-diacylglycerol--glycerol-3-phosphate 3-phosphatidyltransferase n=1 Tax=Carnobacterium iners TaxID=1073423 RepID=A0A1X7NQU7_9LACT|nr:CDP-diacylglycerol--glycerol-3-phosphate 3-phosphatidyltransferase [Carnobacterium iners]SEK26055.1 CDP-diacylglycerol--glycerol-3-phosphate 3-phosphatidyltransferase [Carnobacterium iners]SMH40436.1 CDP-diacylglycerol--glycerol-3-phosphate 3-phosphatidyltransferase [Carnobacterium iners]
MNLPNKLTVVRIFMIPIFVIIALAPLNWGVFQLWGSAIEITQLIAAIIFAVASITDWLDGKIARSRGLVTNFGKFADPLADKMLVMTALIILVEQGLASSWIVAIIVCRELAVTGLRLLLVEQGGTVLAAAWPGKIKTMTQMIAIILLLVDNLPFEGLGIPLADIMLYICLFFTIYSGIDYFVKNKIVFKGSM